MAIMPAEDFVKLFQRRAGLTDDGKAGGNTLAKLDALMPPSASDIPDHPKIPRTHLLGAIAAEQALGVPASVSLAQWALESGWGKFMPAGSNNPFGMKARKNETGPVVEARTREVYTSGPNKGKEYYITTAFRKFKDFAEAFTEHAKLVGTAKVYAPARAKLPDVDAFVDALGPIYATDPNYAKLIKSIMRSNNLYAYNGLRLP